MPGIERGKLVDHCVFNSGRSVKNVVTPPYKSQFEITSYGPAVEFPGKVYTNGL